MPKSSLALVLFTLGAAACGSRSSDGRIVAHAASRLGVEAASLRVSAQSDLEGASHRFHLVTRDGQPVLVVVEPRSGELFDARTPDAFGRVARAESAAENLGQLGAERVALWFAALGGGACPAPLSDETHFATVERGPEGLNIRYEVAGKPPRICVVGLEADGSLRQARIVSAPAPQAQITRPWASDMN